MERAKLRFLLHTNHLPRLNASTRLLIKSHMVMRPLLGSDATLITLFCELDQLTTVRCTSPSSCSSGLKSDFFCSADKMLLHQPAIDVRILSRYKTKIRLIKENWTHKNREKSLRHVSTVVKFLDLNKLFLQIWQKNTGEEINMCDFLVHDWIQEQTVAHTFLPPFVNANGRLGYSLHIKTFEIQKLCYQGKVKSHLCVCCIVTRHFVTCSLGALTLANKKTSLMVTSSYRSMPESSLLSIIFMTSFFFRTHSAYTGDDLFTRKS